MAQQHDAELPGERDVVNFFQRILFRWRVRNVPKRHHDMLLVIEKLRIAAAKGRKS